MIGLDVFMRVERVLFEGAASRVRDDRTTRSPLEGLNEEPPRAGLLHVIQRLKYKTSGGRLETRVLMVKRLSAGSLNSTGHLFDAWFVASVLKRVDDRRLWG